MSARYPYFSRETFAILKNMFSAAVLDHFQHPRNVGKLPNATASVEVTNPVCGDILHLAARVEDQCIVEARFLCQGCTTAIACASFLTVKLTGAKLSHASAITAESISAGLGQLAPATMHAAQLAADALAALLAKIKAA
jgi:nitrogen fixation NifU-like protein